MSRILKYILLLIMALLGMLYIYYWDQLPPRTPYKIVRLQSGLKLPNNLKISEFRDEWSFNGDGFVLVIFDLDEVQELDVLRDIKTKKYKKLPIGDRYKDNFLFTEGFISETDIGYFKVNEFDQGFVLIILNKTKNTLIVFKIIF